MQNIKAAVAVFCTACICAELTAQLTGQGWARRSIKAVAGLYILAVVLCVLPQAKGEWQTFALPAASSVEREELGAEVAIRIELEETSEGVQVHSLTVTPMGEAEETLDAVEELLQHTLGVSPVWDVPGEENAP